MTIYSSSVMLGKRFGKARHCFNHNGAQFRKVKRGSCILARMVTKYAPRPGIIMFGNRNDFRLCLIERSKS